MKNIVPIALVAALAAVTMYSSNLLAHHAFSATFIKDQKASVQGVVTKFSFRNPHVLVYFDVANGDGSVTEWVSEGNSATLLRRSGWDAGSFKAGDVIRVTGDSTHDGSPMTSIDYVEILDPETLSVLETKIRDNSLELYKPAVEDTVPLNLADGRPNLNGVWTIQYRGFGPPPVPSLPLNDAGMAVQNALDLANDPQIFCDPPGLFRQAVTHHPIRFTLNDDHIMMEYEEFAGRRMVYFDSRAAKVTKTHMGDSIARYEGDKLIIETTNLLSNLSTTHGDRLSDQATIVETYHRADTESGRTALNLNIVVSDPLYLAESLAVNKVLWDGGNSYLMLENDCHAPLRERQEVHPAMNFFVVNEVLSEGISADAQCENLAGSMGQGDKNWVAYLDSGNEVGTGPWYNARGVLVAENLSVLQNEIGTSLDLADERGKPIAAMDEEGLFYCFAN